ncbi:DUF2787 family protein [Vibrio parahaemolyticus]|uniref:DUF2787 family protein n=1 Tax=Vibrio parahaemolyticus TaxID=670 RepID=UPI001FAC1450|nr:DUF2787 family protein [Vibrio parahaemolyticus]MCI9689790.1 DUF2787 family protein [Vibrio parahaemolyticus]
MSDINRGNVTSAFMLDSLHQLTGTLLSRYEIPSDTRRLALNLKVSSFYRQRSGIQPVEIQLERARPDSPWEVRFVATFDYPTPDAENVDVALYFNFRHLWFYQPDIKRCELCRPEVQSLFLTWLKAFSYHLKTNRFNTQTLTIVGLFS